MKKVVLFILIVWVVPIVVLARPANPDRVPKNQPLLQPSKDTFLDYESPLSSPVRAEENIDMSDEDVSAEENLDNANQTTPVKSSDKFVVLDGIGWFVLFAVLGLILGYGFWRKLKKS